MQSVFLRYLVFHPLRGVISRCVPQPGSPDIPFATLVGSSEAAKLLDGYDASEIGGPWRGYKQCHQNDEMMRRW